MSKIGKKPIAIPSGVEVKQEGDRVTVKGPKGTLQQALRPEVSLEFKENQVQVNRKDDSKPARSLHGLSRTLVANMVEGVTNGFARTLDIVGIGYKARVDGKKIVMNMGYSHPVEFEPPAGISFEVEKETRITVRGIDKELVGNMAAKIRAVRPPEPYKGKGIMYTGEKVRRKAGKSGKK